jgi:hypothetical protein
MHLCQPTQRSDDGSNAKQRAIEASANEQAATGVGCAKVEGGPDSDLVDLVAYTEKYRHGRQIASRGGKARHPPPRHAADVISHPADA